MNARKQKIEALFGGAMALSSAQRAGYLDQVCGDDADLRREVEELLRASEQAGGFLAVNAGDADSAAGEPPTSPQIQSATRESPGDYIGRYKLREKLGEGGCG